MNHHDFVKPTRWPVDGPDTWIGSECGDTWRVNPLGSTLVAPMYDFEQNEGVTPAEWVRVEPGESR